MAFDLTLLAAQQCASMMQVDTRHHRSSISDPSPPPPCYVVMPQCCMYNEHPPHQVKGTPTAASCVSDPCRIVFAPALGRPAGHKLLSAAVLLIGDGLDRLDVHPLLSHGSHRRPLPTRTFRKYGQLTRSWGAAGCGKPTVSSFGVLALPM